MDLMIASNEADLSVFTEMQLDDEEPSKSLTTTEFSASLQVDAAVVVVRVADPTGAAVMTAHTAISIPAIPFLYTLVTAFQTTCPSCRTKGFGRAILRQ
jgi:hypothetical protein